MNHELLKNTNFTTMLSRNSLALGILLGCVLPGLAWLIFGVLYKDVVLMSRPALPYVIAIGINLIGIRILNKKQADDTVRGIMLATFACMLLLIIFKIRF